MRIFKRYMAGSDICVEVFGVFIIKLLLFKNAVHGMKIRKDGFAFFNESCEKMSVYGGYRVWALRRTIFIGRKVKKYPK